MASAHDLSDGGLAQVLVESCLRRGVGARVWLPEGMDVFVGLFGESTSRALVTVADGDEARFAALCTTHGVPRRRIGVTAGLGDDAVLDVQDAFTVPLAELRAAWSATLPAVFAG